MELASQVQAPAPRSESIPEAEARLLLARRFYAFAAVEWLPFEVAVKRARKEKKPLHAVLLFGSLDDESC
jgi:hypothetical protein